MKFNINELKICLQTKYVYNLFNGFVFITISKRVHDFCFKYHMKPQFRLQFYTHVSDSKSTGTQWSLFLSRYVQYYIALLGHNALFEMSCVIIWCSRPLVGINRVQYNQRLFVVFTSLLNDYIALFSLHYDRHLVCINK